MYYMNVSKEILIENLQLYRNRVGSFVSPKT